MIVANDEAPGPGRFGRSGLRPQGEQLRRARARYDLYAESYLGAIFTHRGFMDSHSTLGALDGNFRLGQTQAVGFKLAQTDHRDMDGVSRQGQMVDLSYRLNSRHWNSFVASVHAVARLPARRRLRAAGGHQAALQPARLQLLAGELDRQLGPEHPVRPQPQTSPTTLDDEDVRLGFTARFARNISFNADVREEMERYRGFRFHKAGGVGRRAGQHEPEAGRSAATTAKATR